ncbi:phosphodiesterase [Mycobacterium sp. 852002-50816_SCH5313054-b]|uniref:phosphodiesterase n=1 Tax=Mycobacterium sp. 852002-50816_SCH5313054-b TaxID=1834092 RepID=UPI00080208F7|nr:phosphodiesterase [Mycobacterium sp. 852002-50816_SCH5313054-b]OBF60437.1 phosphodiesterase [Mycobacterium sp. 852002-50816_SCH5313054-b]
MNVSNLVTKPFQWGSALRGRRFFHPVGVLAHGFIERTAPAADGLPLPSCEVVARVSKAAGTPGALPDFIGLAFRVAPQQEGGGTWDILLVSAGSGVLARAVALRPAVSWGGQTLTSLMPLRYQGNTWWLRARSGGAVDGFGLSLDSVRRAIDGGGIDFAIDQACGRGDFAPLARLTLTGVLDRETDVSFDPVANTAPGLSLYPEWLAELRGRAYRRSRDGREAG